MLNGVIHILADFIFYLFLA